MAKKVAAARQEVDELDDLLRSAARAGAYVPELIGDILGQLVKVVRAQQNALEQMESIGSLFTLEEVQAKKREAAK